MSVKRTIGRLAEETGVSVETIRFYERKGLIEQPASDDGYRHYDDRIVATVRYIKLAQRLGLKLSDVETLKARLGDGEGFCLTLRETARGRLARIGEEMAELRRLEAELTGFLERCERRDRSAPCPIVSELGALSAAATPTKTRGARTR